TIDVVTDGENEFLGIVAGQPGWILRSVDFGRTWNVVYIAYIELDPGLQDCLHAGVHNPSYGPWFELWDAEISLHANDPLILVVGGVGVGCGLILASEDDGLTWNQEFHECRVDPALDCTDLVAFPEYDPDFPPYHHTTFRTIYGVAIDS